jgi:hypothetical protein
MPVTFTHPLAVLPVRRWGPKWLNFAALVIGSMTPDLGYYLRAFPIARYAHTIMGTFTICLPSGLLVLGLFYLLREPLCFILPQPHRGALMPLASARLRWSVAWFCQTVVSILLGAWTHTIWDSFTHDNAWSVARIPALNETLFRIHGTVFPAYYLLQQFSTFVGGATLVLLYCLWLRRQPRPPVPAREFSDGLRYGVLLILAIVALLLVLPTTRELASHYHGYTAFRVLVFRTGVYTAAAFIPMATVAAVTLFALYRRKMRKAN